MARMTRQTGLRIEIESNIPAVQAALKDARREFGRAQRDAMIRVANQVSVPLAKSLAPRILRSHIGAGATLSGGAYLTSVRIGGWRRARFWYLHGIVKNYGAVCFPGAIRKPFSAKPGKPIPITTGGGIVFRMSVTRPRVIRRPKKFLIDGVRRSVPAHEAAIQQALVDAIQSKVNEVSIRVLAA